jgi:release factor glutamine methyltransferase
VDVIVSNPPYVTEEEYATLPEEVRREPYEALVGGTDVHRRLAEAGADTWLRDRGWLVMEIGTSQASEVVAMLEQAFEQVEVLQDLTGRDRVIRARRRG